MHATAPGGKSNKRHGPGGFGGALGALGAVSQREPSGWTKWKEARSTPIRPSSPFNGLLSQRTTARCDVRRALGFWILGGLSTTIRSSTPCNFRAND